jgi:hypothetical protein
MVASRHFLFVWVHRQGLRAQASHGCRQSAGLTRARRSSSRGSAVPLTERTGFPLILLAPDLSVCFGFWLLPQRFSSVTPFSLGFWCRTCFEASARSADLRLDKFSRCTIFVTPLLILLAAPVSPDSCTGACRPNGKGFLLLGFFSHPCFPW